jgi:hypothetical protein
MLLYVDYKSLVVQDYQKKRVDNILHSGLIDPSPARLRDACLEICRDRYSDKDERTLKEFFGQGSDKAACLRAIERLEAAKFKPLAKFLNKLTGNTERKNIELLAWLVDFKGRPFEYGKKYIPPDPKNSQDKSQGPSSELTIKVQENEAGQKGDKILNPTPSGQERVNKRSRRLIVTITISVAFGMIVYLLWINKPSTPVVTGREACMFWAHDHYQPVSCSMKLENTLVIGLDSEMIAHFKKINRPDTITLNAIGSVWYVKYRGTIEFYTDSGFHPIDPNLRLKPITAYIIRKYIHGENIQEEPGK